MQSIEEKKSYYRVIKSTCYTACIVYVLLHIIYLTLSLISKTYILVWLNVASIFIYSLFPLLIRKGKYFLYALLCGNEFLIFMSVSTILSGFETGYFLCIVGIGIVSFFTTYFTKKRNIKNSIIWNALSLSICITLYLYCRFNEPYYKLDKWLISTLFVIHLIAVFVFIVVYLLIILNYATKLEDRIIKESRNDRLTQIHNRNALYMYLESITDKTDYALAIFDIDDFKKFNDNYGHIVGDFVLKEVARVSTEFLSESFVARYGGEEFIVVMKMNGSFNKVYNRIEELRIVMERYVFTYNDLTLNLTITTGLKQYQENLDIDEWINQADKLLYQGKNSGKNKTVI
jgi:diguanylate cyclase (GGDEF)-like protein